MSRILTLVPYRPAIVERVKPPMVSLHWITPEGESGSMNFCTDAAAYAMLSSFRPGVNACVSTGYHG